MSFLYIKGLFVDSKGCLLIVRGGVTFMSVYCIACVFLKMDIHMVNVLGPCNIRCADHFCLLFYAHVLFLFLICTN